ncbi:MAG: septum formation inhibitor Maf [Hydrocarboniphaga effusa]|nr:septum formation inhibitor Maf [Hydrocarboniphaga effusa]
MQPQLYLASRSPRRQELLRQVNLRFEVLPVDVSERREPGQSPAEYARAVSLAKARAAMRLTALPLPVLGADTDVVLDGEILGKPDGRAAALAMLAKLSGRSHEVFSAVALVGGRRAETALSVSRVTFGKITPAMAAAYWDSFEPADKAGAYAIQGQGARFVRHIEGSYSGVMGLPLYETCELLQRFGVEVLSPA